MKHSVVSYVLLVVAIQSACSGPGPVGEPLRPRPMPSREGERTDIDCESSSDALSHGSLPSVPAMQRDEAAAARHVALARTTTNASAKAMAYHDALAADPYDVEATYQLAALEAGIGRMQCAAELVTRLGQLRGLASRREQAIERSTTVLAPSDEFDPFSEVRHRPEFQAALRRMCSSFASASEFAQPGCETLRDPARR